MRSSSYHVALLVGVAHVALAFPFKSNHQKRDQSTLATSASTLNIALVVELCAIYLDLVSAATLLGDKQIFVTCQALINTPSSSSVIFPATPTLETSSTSTPIICPSGSGISPGNPTCSVCLAGTYSYNNLCLPCGGSTYSSAGSSSCVPCLHSVGQAGITCDPKTGNALSVLAGYNFLAGQIIPCSPGYSSIGGFTSSCLPCVAGTFANLSNSGFCSNCTAIAGTNVTACDPKSGNPLQILPGYSYISGNVAACLSGTFSPGGSLAASVCNSCLPGFYSKAMASSCIACIGVAGQNYTTCDLMTGNDLTCPAGLGLGVNTLSVSNVTCSSCNAGFYSAIGATSCAICSNNSWSNTIGGAASCITCDVGLSSPAGSTSSQACLAVGTIMVLNTQTGFLASELLGNDYCNDINIDYTGNLTRLSVLLPNLIASTTPVTMLTLNAVGGGNLHGNAFTLSNWGNDFNPPGAGLGFFTVGAIGSVGYFNSPNGEEICNDSKHLGQTQIVILGARDAIGYPISFSIVNKSGVSNVFQYTDSNSVLSMRPSSSDSLIYFISDA